jgi:hypothetical protein
LGFLELFPQTAKLIHKKGAPQITGHLFLYELRLCF